MTKKRSIFIISLGCDKNRIDAELMAAKLKDGGYTVCSALNRADCVLINTCGFIDSAKREGIDVIFEMIKEKEAPETRLSKIVVTGCIAQRYPEEMLSELPEVDASVGLAFNADIVSIIDRVFDGERIFEGGNAMALPLEGKRFLSTPRHYAYLKIAEGCSNRCTYCAIPSIRGPYRSREPDSIIKEAKKLARYGTKQLFIIAQDTTAYGQDLEVKTSLAELLKRLCEIDGIWKITILYAYPERITDELLEVMATNDKIAKYLDMPIQHCSESVLRRMGRFGNEQQILELVEKIRSRMPDITLRSTFIVGFPGESENDFNHLLEFMSVVRFNLAGCFAFSREEGTPAAKLKDDVDPEIKRQRAEQFELKQSLIIDRYQYKKVGKILEVICDGYDEKRMAFICRSESDVPEIDTVVRVFSPELIEPGTVLRVKILSQDPESNLDLIAEPEFLPEVDFMI